MKHFNKQHLALVLKIIIVLLLVGLVFLTTSLIKQYRQIQHLDYIQAARANHSFSPVRGNTPITANDTAQIQTWMTFDYVNHLFNVPPNYLKTNLNIADTKYPRLTISQYAKKANVDKSILLGQVQQFVKLYFASSMNAIPVMSAATSTTATSTAASIATSTAPNNQ